MGETGFQPKEFVSSSKNRAARTRNRMEDLFDEEDLATIQNLISVRPEFDVNRKMNLYKDKGGKSILVVLLSCFWSSCVFCEAPNNLTCSKNCELWLFLTAESFVGSCPLFV